MTIKIMIKRKVPEGKRERFLALISKLRGKAIKQPGYITGEALRNADNPEEYLVISTWNSINEWDVWKSSKERSGIQAEIDEFLGTKSQYEVYQYLAS
jgi:heme-degrading monooxygenase HmoA